MECAGCGQWVISIGMGVVCGLGAGNGGAPPTLAVAPGPPRINLRVLVACGEPGTRAVDTDDATPLAYAALVAVGAQPPCEASHLPPDNAQLRSLRRRPATRSRLWGVFPPHAPSFCPVIAFPVRSVSPCNFLLSSPSSRTVRFSHCVPPHTSPTPLVYFALPGRGLAPAHLLRRASPLFTPPSRSWHKIFVHHPPEVRCIPPPFVQFPPKPFLKQRVPFPLPTCPLSLQRVRVPYPRPPSHFLPRRPSIPLPSSAPCPFFAL